MTLTGTELASEKLTVEEFTEFQTAAIRFLADTLTNAGGLSEEELKPRIIAAQTLLSCEPPLDTEAFIAGVREKLHQELKDAGIDVDGALASRVVH